MPIDVRSVSLAVIALMLGIFMLHWASAVFIPLLLGVMSSYALSPVVARMERWHIPRALGAAVLLTAIVGGLGSLLYSLSDDATALASSLPDAAQKLREAVREAPGAAEGTIEKVQRAAAKIEEAAEGAGSAAPAASKGVTRVQIERPHFNIKDYLWGSTLGLAGLVGQATVVLFITFFLLASGNSFRRKMAALIGGGSLFINTLEGNLLTPWLTGRASRMARSSSSSACSRGAGYGGSGGSSWARAPDDGQGRV